MSESLLAHLYTHIRGSQEDIATISLQYILSQSIALDDAFCDLISYSLNSDIGHGIRYVCQATGENLERPDIAGINDSGHEVVLCEAKFYAGLTENQPLAYIDRLIKNNGHGLVFICPEARKASLWATILDRCKERMVSDLSGYHALVDKMPIIVITWQQIIEILRITASAQAVSSLSDIDQLEGFCKKMDSEAFIPFTSEEFGSIEARKAERFYQVVNAVIDVLRADKSLRFSMSGYRATPFRYGYCRYFNMRDFAYALHYNRQMWQNPSSVDTPFWVSITEGGWKQEGRIMKAFKVIPETRREIDDGHLFLPLFAKTNATLDEVAKDMAEQILNYTDMITTEEK